MKKVLLEYKKELQKLLVDKYILIFTFITIALGFGFALTNPSIGIDDTANNIYFHGGELLAQGRFFPIIISKLIGGISFTPFWMELISIIMMVIAAMLYCCLFKRVTKNKLGNICYVLFITIFISYPIINEIFIYNNAVISIGIGYLFTAASTIFLYEYLAGKKNSLLLVTTPILLMTAVISTYESFVTVFLLGLAMVLFLQYLYNYKEISFDKKIWIKYFTIFIIAIIASIILEYGLTAAYMTLKHITVSHNPSTEIFWIKHDFVPSIIYFYKSMIEAYIKPNFSYLSILVLQIVTFLFIIFAIVMSKIRRNWWILGFALFVIFSFLSLNFLQGYVTQYRSCQSFAIFIAFASIVMFDNIPKRLRPLILIAIIYLVAMQTYDLTKWFYNDNLRYQEEKTVMLNVANDIKHNFDYTKPVVFIGSYILSPNVRHIQVNTNGNSLINWGTGCFYECGEQLLVFLKMNGMYFKSPTTEQYKAVIDNVKGLEKYPKANSIIEYNGIIVVNF